LTVTENEPPADAIAELRRTEEGCLARIISINRKLAGGSTAVSVEVFAGGGPNLERFRST
jgi:hypothetical protein